jgi:hypothetical protein
MGQTKRNMFYKKAMLRSTTSSGAGGKKPKKTKDFLNQYYIY